MNKHQSGAPLAGGPYAKHRNERGGKRRLVKELLRQRLRTRRLWSRLMAGGAAAGALATVAWLAQYGAQA